jgi:hypothetical protein
MLQYHIRAIGCFWENFRRFITSPMMRIANEKILLEGNGKCHNFARRLARSAMAAGSSILDSK